jgi:hypothetical protein
MTDHDYTPTNPTDRVAAALERIAAALERAYPDPALTLRDSQVKLAIRYPVDDTGQAASDAWQAQMPNADEWIAWSGGECPVPPDTLIYIRNNTGFEPPPTCAGIWCWTTTNLMSSIVAYRLAK